MSVEKTLNTPQEISESLSQNKSVSILYNLKKNFKLNQIKLEQMENTHYEKNKKFINILSLYVKKIDILKKILEQKKENPIKIFVEKIIFIRKNFGILKNENSKYM